MRQAFAAIALQLSFLIPIPCRRRHGAGDRPVGRQPRTAADSRYAAIVVDANTGKTLYSSSSESRRYPASLTKMMTLYLTFEAMAGRQDHQQDLIPFSAQASAQPPTKLGVKAGKSITVETAIYALVTKSANDAATALGEYLGGSEAGLRPHDDGQGAPPRHDGHRLPQCDRPSRYGPVHDRPRHGHARHARCASTSRSTTPISRRAPSPMAASAWPTTTGCSAGSRASTASRPATPARRASTSSRRSGRQPPHRRRRHGRHQRREPRPPDGRADQEVPAEGFGQGQGRPADRQRRQVAGDVTRRRDPAQAKGAAARAASG